MHRSLEKAFPNKQLRLACARPGNNLRHTTHTRIVHQAKMAADAVNFSGSTVYVAFVESLKVAFS
jgi:hypothetical protein